MTRGHISALMFPGANLVPLFLWAAGDFLIKDYTDSQYIYVPLLFKHLGLYVIKDAQFYLNI